MRMAKFVKAAFALGIVAACVVSLGACANSSDSSAGGAAATVNGTEISEEEITTNIQNMREQYSLADEESWGKYLVEIDQTPEDFRKQLIDGLVDKELLKSGGESLDVTVESSEVDKYVDEMKANFDSDEKWAEALKQAGFTEEEYRTNIEESLQQRKITEHFTEGAKVDDKELLKTAQDYAQYYDGAKRSSHILFKVESGADEAAKKKVRQKAQEVLDQLKAGKIDFAAAAKKYSEDEGSAKNGGDVGWDMLSSFVTEYSDALAGLDKDQMSDLVESEYGFHIIKCTDVFKAPKKLAKFSQLPEAFQTSIKEMAKSQKANEDYEAWLKEQREKADIVINDMPADVPYNVDLSKYKTSDSDENADEAAEGEDGDLVEFEDEEAATADGEEAEGEASADGETEEVVELEEADKSEMSSEAAASKESSDASASSAAAEEKSDASASSAAAEEKSDASKKAA